MNGFASIKTDVLDLLTSMPPYVLIIVGIVIVISMFLFFILRDKNKAKSEPDRGEVDTGDKAPENTSGVADNKGTYRAYHWTKNEGIKLIRIEKPIGSLWTADTTMPESGGCYLVMDGDKEGEPYKDYEPRSRPMVDGERPQVAYDHSHCNHLVNNMYSAPRSTWDKVNMMMPYAAIFGLFIVMMILGDKL